ncbi:L-fuculose-phosphate aldolase [Lagierella sp.]|uniref:L-fuculose-phosphate aldolase n=1 Tax=Lagierella sp. TaxID=2849657 RepID=UPI002609B60C|nr:L-fuculose-phosphate aldolase [Lagierella sp.]
MRFFKERLELVDGGNKLLDLGLTKGTGGNLSIYIRDEGLMLITPSGIEYPNLKPEDMVLMDLKGNIVEGDLKPSSEHRMHSIVYETRDDINAIVHSHTTYCGAVSCLRENLKAVHYMIAVGGGKDVRCAEYATFGTEELAKNALRAMEDRKAVLLANHGLLAGAEDIANAINITDELEFVAKIYFLTKSVGNPVILSDEEMDLMKIKFANYGNIKGK